METDINAIVEVIRNSYGAAAGGALVVVSSLCYGTIKIIRLALVQSLLQKISPKLCWVNWPRWGAALFVFALTFLGGLLATLATNLGWLPAIIGAFTTAIPVALGAMGVDAAVGTVTNKPSVPVNENPSIPAPSQP